MIAHNCLFEEKIKNIHNGTIHNCSYRAAVVTDIQESSLCGTQAMLITQHLKTLSASCGVSRASIGLSK